MRFSCSTLLILIVELNSLQTRWDVLENTRGQGLLKDLWRLIDCVYNKTSQHGFWIGKLLKSLT